MKTIKTLLGLGLFLAGGAFARAEDPAFGFQAALAFPANDLTNVANLGLQVGGHGRWDFGGGHGIMGRADLAFYGSKDGVSTSSYGLGADYTYHIDHNRRGVYFLAGLSFMGYSLSGGGDSASRSGIGIDLGVGYDLNRHVGLQARYTTHNLDHATMSSLNLGCTYTF